MAEKPVIQFRPLGRGISPLIVLPGEVLDGKFIQLGKFIQVYIGGSKKEPIFISDAPISSMPYIPWNVSHSQLLEGLLITEGLPFEKVGGHNGIPVPVKKSRLYELVGCGGIQGSLEKGFEIYDDGFCYGYDEGNSYPLPPNLDHLNALGLSPEQTEKAIKFRVNIDPTQKYSPVSGRWRLK